MDYCLNEKQQLIRKTAHDIAQKEIAARAGEIDQKSCFPWNNLEQLAAADLLGLNVPSQFGGMETDKLSYVLVIEEIARACASTALITVAHSFATQGLLMFGSEDQKKKYLSSLAKGNKLGAFAVHEANSGCNHAVIETDAALEGDSYVLNGSKFLITSGGRADVYLLLARTDKSKGPAGISMFIVEKDTAGFEFGEPYRKMGLNGACNTDLYLNNCRIPKQNLLGREGEGLKLLEAVVPGLIMFGAAAISLGISSAALRSSIRHARERVISGEPIGSNRAVQFLIAEMNGRVDGMRAYLYTAAAGGEFRNFEALQIKLFASEAAVEVADKALRVHGGHGYCKDLPVERYYRDARGLIVHFNITEMLKAAVGEAVLNST